MNKIKKISRYIIIVILTIIIISGLTYILIIQYKENKEKKDYNDLAKYMQEEIHKTNNEITKTDRMIKLEELHNDNNDVVAWIEIPDTNVNYPVLQTDDNSYYLTHNYKKEYSERGSIYLNKDVDLQAPSHNFLIYGHRNKNGAMFEDVFKYSKKNFYESHKKIKFTTLTEDSEYEILSAFYSRVYYKSETNAFRYYRFINAQTEEEYNDYVSNAKKASIYDTGVDAKYGDKLLTLSTCEYSQDDGRFVVVAKEVTNN